MQFWSALAARAGCHGRRVEQAEEEAKEREAAGAAAAAPLLAASSLRECALQGGQGPEGLRRHGRQQGRQIGPGGGHGLPAQDGLRPRRVRALRQARGRVRPRLRRLQRVPRGLGLPQRVPRVQAHGRRGRAQAGLRRRQGFSGRGLQGLYREDPRRDRGAADRRLRERDVRAGALRGKRARRRPMFRSCRRGIMVYRSSSATARTAPSLSRVSSYEPGTAPTRRSTSTRRRSPSSSRRRTSPSRPSTSPTTASARSSRRRASTPRRTCGTRSTTSRRRTRRTRATGSSSRRSASRPSPSRSRRASPAARPAPCPATRARPSPRTACGAWPCTSNIRTDSTRGYRGASRGVRRIAGILLPRMRVSSGGAAPGRPKTGGSRGVFGPRAASGSSSAWATLWRR